jgi:3-hydroxybutyryl-CoA dehydrogenase
VAVEDLKVKQKIFQKAAALAEANAVLATNTSTLSIAKIGKDLSPRVKKRLAGMHFFNPPQVMKLVEVVKTKETSEETLGKIQEIVRALGKVPILVQDNPSFVANRIGISVFAEASQLLEHKIASVRDIDLSMRLGYGYPLGPFELGDLVGLDARLRNMKTLYAQTKDPRFRPPRILRKLVIEGYLGDPKTKPGSKGGYYEYFGLKRPSEE